MTQLVRWEPFLKDFSALAQRINRMFETALEEPEGEWFGTWYPPVDIYDTGAEIVLQAELPGMKKDDIDIRVENNVLRIFGQRKREFETREGNVFRSERSYGTFSRSFTLPTTVDAKNIQATYKDGVLTVTLPKAEEARPRQIEVKVA